jgi:hypothetical protein
VTATVRERLPQPLTMTGIVSVDNLQRNLVVRRPESLSGHEKLWWRTAHEQLVRAQEAGWPRNGAPYLFAHGAGQSDIAHGVPGDRLTLLFHFPAGKDAYVKLVSQPGLSAFVTVDRSSGWFTGVRFRHNRRAA